MKAQASKRKPIVAVAVVALTGGLAACGGESGSPEPENIIVDDGGIIDETPTSEAQVDEAPVEEAPVDEAPAEEAPVDEEPAEEAPAEEAPADESTG